MKENQRNKEEQQRLDARKQQILKMAKEFKCFKTKDDYRDPAAGYYGGFQLTDNELTSRLRGAGKEILKSVGKKILSGKFNLTTISFPIKCMCPLSMLEIMASIVGVHSFYMNAAALTKDPLERMKLVMACSVAYIFPTHQFEKPVRSYLHIILLILNIYS